MERAAQILQRTTMTLGSIHESSILIDPPLDSPSRINLTTEVGEDTHELSFNYATIQ